MVGTALCERLLRDDHEVTGVDRVANVWSKDVEVRTIRTDLAQEHGADMIPASDLVVHLAANARVHDLVVDPLRAQENMRATHAVLERCRLAGIPRLVFSSSREVYGNGGGVEPRSETIIPVSTCESPYTAGKIADEAMIQAYRRCYGLRAAIVRLSNVYGRYDDSTRVVPRFIREARSHQALTVYGAEKQLDFTWLDDAVDGIVRVIQRLDNVDGEAFNLATGNGTSLHQLAQWIQQAVGTDVPVRAEPTRVGEITQYIADITKARTRLGYEPAVLTEEGVRRAVEWYTNR